MKINITWSPEQKRKTNRVFTSVKFHFINLGWSRVVKKRGKRFFFHQERRMKKDAHVWMFCRTDASVGKGSWQKHICRLMCGVKRTSDVRDHNLRYWLNSRRVFLSLALLVSGSSGVFGVSGVTGVSRSLGLLVSMGSWGHWVFWGLWGL